MEKWRIGSVVNGTLRYTWCSVMAVQLRLKRGVGTCSTHVADEKRLYKFSEEVYINCGLLELKAVDEKII
jgi:hypothetical protein